MLSTHIMILICALLYSFFPSSFMLYLLPFLSLPLLCSAFLTFLCRVKAVVSWNILYIVNQCSVGQKSAIFVYAVDCILERQL